MRDSKLDPLNERGLRSKDTVARNERVFGFQVNRRPFIREKATSEKNQVLYLEPRFVPLVAPRPILLALPC
jgi:hypothetical protein